MTEDRDYPSWTLTARQLCDLELLLCGGFAPLRGFLNQSDYLSVRDSMRLASGAVWPIPVTLGVDGKVAAAAEKAGRLVLRVPDGTMVARLRVEDVWRPDRLVEAEAVFGTRSSDHGGVAQFLAEPGECYIGGAVEGLRRPEHFDFQALRHTPEDLRAEFTRRGWSRVVAFQTRNPIHRSHFELTVRAMQSTGAALLIHPVVGETRTGDIDYFTRVRCYQALLPRYPADRAMLSLLPLAMRLAGPREALWHALIRKNYGCTEFIVGRDHAGPGSAPDGTPFYGPYDAQELVKGFEREIGIAIVPSEELVYLPDQDVFAERSRAGAGTRVLTLSGTDLRRRLAGGEEIPEWFTFPEVAAELRRAEEKSEVPGATIWLTGLPGAGKSTLGRAVVARLLESGRTDVSLLDGDLLRKTISADLGFTKADRDEHVRRVGRLAAEITRRGGIAVCAVIAPYDSVRREIRRTMEGVGQFVLVYVTTPIEVCEARDSKGGYARARAGLLPNFTGISDPYEEPRDAELLVDTSQVATDEGVTLITQLLRVSM